METRKIKDLIPYDKNPRKNEKAVEKVLNSLRNHGQVKPIVLSAVGFPFEQEVICCGHTTALALKEFGAEEVKVIVHKFDTEKDFVKYNIEDNKTGEFAEWDEAILADLNASLDLGEDLLEMGFLLGDEFQKENDYTSKIETPTHEPSEEKPDLSDLFDDTKTKELLDEINNSDIEEEIKEFLRYCAQRHRVFNYEKIADFYAHSDSEVQNLMENSALVIIDFKKAIEKGYVKLTQRIKDVYEIENI